MKRHESSTGRGWRRVENIRLHATPSGGERPASGTLQTDETNHSHDDDENGQQNEQNYGTGSCCYVYDIRWNGVMQTIDDRSDAQPQIAH